MNKFFIVQNIRFKILDHYWTLDSIEISNIYSIIKTCVGRFAIENFLQFNGDCRDYEDFFQCPKILCNSFSGQKFKVVLL